jgi:hypothetical protein
MCSGHHHGMTRSSAVLLLVAAAGTSARAAVIVPDDPQLAFKAVADRLHASVIAVRARATVALSSGSDAPQSVQTPLFGTGILIGDGLAITTLHTVAAVVPGKMTAWSDIEALLQGSGPVPAEITAWFPELGLAVLRVAKTASAEEVVFASDAPVAGEALVAMGTDDETVSVVGVTVAATRGDELILSSSRRVDSRYWGGPLFDVHGRLAGITLPSLTPRAVSSLAIASLVERFRSR